jgi:hypothetical protein
VFGAPSLHGATSDWSISSQTRLGDHAHPGNFDVEV